jgi:transcriptional regulator with XRE-family HTH domain
LELLSPYLSQTYSKTDEIKNETVKQILLTLETEGKRKVQDEKQLKLFCLQRTIMNLSEKIELLIKRKQLSASQFADKLGIPRSSISHILSGRNKPSLDVVQKILRVFPEITAEDLLFEDRTLGSLAVVKEIVTTPTTPSLFDPVLPTPSESVKNILPEQTIVQSNLRRTRESNNSERVSSVPLAVSDINPTYLEKKIERVLIFYSDGTFSESKPQS